MNHQISNEFDPFQVIISFASQTNNADLFIEVFTGIGIAFDVNSVGPDAHSHGNRIRALRPRVLEAYNGLSQAAKLVAANAATGRFATRIRRLQQVPALQGFSEEMFEALHKIGWGFQEGRLVAMDPQVREMFFPKGSQWDAFVAIREVIDKARNELILVDPYCDREFFHILESSSTKATVVRLLCQSKPSGLKAEAEKFVAQHRQMTIQLRTSSDFHDRFLVVDQSTCVHIGASINHAGSRAFMISPVEDARNRNVLINAMNEAWKSGTEV